MRRIVMVIITLLGCLVLFMLTDGERHIAQQAQTAYEIEAAITPAPTLAPPTLFARATQALLRQGHVSLDVVHLQERLIALGYLSGEADGQFGGGTKEAVEHFQAQHGLTADGMAGEATLALLYSDRAQAYKAR